MMDGSLEPYYPYWDETFAFNSTSLTGSGGSPSANSLGSVGSGSADTTRNGVASGEHMSGEGSGGGAGVPVGMPTMGSGIGGMNMGMDMGMGYNDLWAAMTMDWAGGGDVENWA